MWLGIVVLAVMFAFFRFLFLVYADDKKTWNCGICVETNKPWFFWKTDSYGIRWYCSGETGNRVFVQIPWAVKNTTREVQETV